MGGNTMKDGAKQSGANYRTYSEEPASYESSDEDFTHIPSEHVSLEKDRVESYPDTTEGRPITRSRKAKVRNTKADQ
jgi:hypothetical protein